MRIAFDVDGVVLNSIQVILDYINSKSGTSLQSDKLITWELEPLGIDFATLEDAVDHMYMQQRLEPYEDAVETLTHIYRAGECRLATIRILSQVSRMRHVLISGMWPHFSRNCSGTRCIHAVVHGSCYQ